MSDIQIKEVGILRLQPGDILVFTCPVENPTQETIASLQQMLRGVFPNNPSFVVGLGGKFEIIRPDVVVE